jgi:hypothetical protein
MSHTTVVSEKHRKARDWLMKSGYGLEMRVAAECRKRWLPTTPSVPYVIQRRRVREADVVVRFGNQLSMSGDSWSLAAVIECKSPTAKPWAALMVPDKVTGFEAVLRSRTQPMRNLAPAHLCVERFRAVQRGCFG